MRRGGVAGDGTTHKITVSGRDAHRLSTNNWETGAQLDLNHDQIKAAVHLATPASLQFASKTIKLFSCELSVFFDLKVKVSFPLSFFRMESNAGVHMARLNCAGGPQSRMWGTAKTTIYHSSVRAPAQRGPTLEFRLRDIEINFQISPSPNYFLIPTVFFGTKKT